MQSKLNLFPNSSLSSISSVSGLDTIGEPRHRWYFVKESFSPTFVRYAIAEKNCTKDDLVIDPFAGSGTVPLVATDYGSETIGIEVNPFLAFVSRAKLTHCRPDTVEKHLSEIVAGISLGTVSPLERFSTFTKTDKYHP